MTLSTRLVRLLPSTMLALALCVGGPGGCDAREDEVRTSPAALPPPPPPAINVSSVLTLRPDTRTILRPFDGGTVLVGQTRTEPNTPAVTLRLLRPDGETRRAPFDGAAIAGLLNVPTEQLIVRDALPLGGGRCLVFVNGFAGQRALLGLWLYRPGAGGLTQLADARQLGRASGLGDSADIADGRLIAGGRGAWLWLSGFGQTAVVRCGFDASDAAPDLRRVDQRLTDEAGRPIDLGDGSVWPIDDTTAVFLRPGQATAFRIDLTTFTATEIPAALPPVRTASRGVRTTWAFTTGDTTPRTEADTWTTADGPRFPRITLTPADAATPPTTIDRDGLHARLGFPVHALRLTQWCPEPTPGRVLAYDAMSGEILRLVVGE